MGYNSPLTFEEWYKNNVLFDPWGLLEEYEDYVSEWKIKNLLEKAFEAGRQSK